MRPVDAEEARWRRRSDARTLAEAEQIKADKERYNGAILGAKEIAQEEIARVQGIAKVAGMKAPQTPKAPENTGTPTHNNFGFTATAEPQCRPRRSNPATIGRF